MSFWAGQLTLHFPGQVQTPKWLTSTYAHTFGQEMGEWPKKLFQDQSPQKLFDQAGIKNLWPLNL